VIFYSLDRDGRTVRATFCLNGTALLGQQVSVVGDFNDWDLSAAPMVEEDGLHTATLVLEPGRRYRFHYLLTADGATVNDLDADEVEIDPSGRRNSIIDLTFTAPLAERG
jgi:1,4-alpha-glucan branching enzyme